MRISILIPLLCLLACSSDMPEPGPGPGAAALRIVGSPVVNLAGEGRATLTVIYETTDGEPIAGATLGWSIDGEGAGSRLSAPDAVTNADGEASVALIAGIENAMYGVEVSASDARARFEVVVSDRPLGSITVSMGYEGPRSLVRFETQLYQGEDCASLMRSTAPEPARSAPSVDDIRMEPAFAGLMAADDYTVTVVARADVDVAARGCTDNISVATSNVVVDVALTDVELPPDFTGEWDLDNRLDFGGALPPSTEAVLDVLTEIGDDDRVDGAGSPDFELTDVDGDGYAPEFGVDPGAFMTDIVMRQTCHWECLSGEDYEDCSSVNHPLGNLELLYTENFGTWDGAQSRVRGGCYGWEYATGTVQNLINREVAARVPDFSLTWSRLVSDLARAVTDARILSHMTIRAGGAADEFSVPFTHELVEMVVDYENPNSDPPGAVESRTFALVDAGLTSLSATDVSRVEGDTLVIPAHSFNIDFAQLTLYIYRQVLLDAIFGVTSTGELLSSFVDCRALSEELEDAIDEAVFPLVGPSAATLEDYCVAALGTIGTILEDELAGSLTSDGMLTLEGTAIADDVDFDTGLAQSLADGVWGGTFAEAGMSSELSGRFTGVLAAAE